MTENESIEEETLRFTLTLQETNLLLEGLGHLPFAKVHQLVASIQQQAQAQLGQDNQPQDK